jgi:PleD family two-component response regulator
MRPTLPQIRVTKAKAGTSTKPAQAFDVGIYDVLVKVVNNAGRLRARLDGCESRLEHLEELLKRGYR